MNVLAKEYADSYAELAMAVHLLSARYIQLTDEVELSGCSQMTHTSLLGKDKGNVPYVHIYKGLRELARRLDIVPNVIEDYGDMDRCVWFEYRGVEFIQLEDREGSEKG